MFFFCFVFFFSSSYPSCIRTTRSTTTPTRDLLRANSLAFTRSCVRTQGQTHRGRNTESLGWCHCLLVTFSLRAHAHRENENVRWCHCLYCAPNLPEKTNIGENGKEKNCNRICLCGCEPFTTRREGAYFSAGLPACPFIYLKNISFGPGPKISQSKCKIHQNQKE